MSEVWDCAVPSIPRFWLCGGYLKEESEGHTDAAALCLVKKWALSWCREQMKVMGRRE